MNGNLTADHKNPVVIRKMGINALTKELGLVGMAYFMQQFDRGEGDYTKERELLLTDVSIDSLADEIYAMRKNK